MKDELIAGATTIAASSLGSVTVATVPVAVTTTASAGGLAGLLGFTTTVTTVASAPVTLPIGGIIAVGSILTYAGYKTYKHLKNSEKNDPTKKHNSI